MSLFFAIGNTIFGIYLILIGFRKAKPFRKVSDEALEEWYRRYGRMAKVVGILVLTIGVHSLFKNLLG